MLPPGGAPTPGRAPMTESNRLNSSFSRIHDCLVERSLHLNPATAPATSPQQRGRGARLPHRMPSARTVHTGGRAACNTPQRPR